MTRFLAIVLALVIPLQSAWAAIGPVVGGVDAGCARSTWSAAAHHDHAEPHAGARAAGATDCHCEGLPHGGAHRAVHHHGCSHFGVAMAAAALAEAAPPAPAGSAPDSTSASFESVVLDVPSPPPTALA